ncbi:MAG TPA: response regulator transcription factor [Vicinamibacterales bacterium]|nr:response regulator transcription factor [Vicinamibacterales bacterium]
MMMGSADVAPQPIRIAVIEDEREIRECFNILIDRADGVRCTGAYRTMEGALEAFAHDGAPDVALLDIGLPGMSGIDGVRELKQRWPDVRAVMLTVYEDDERIFDALCAGACGYLLKRTPPDRLLEGVRDVMNGGAPMSPEVARRVITLFRTVRPAREPDSDLTPHEIRLLKMLADGHSYRTAAATLGVTVHGVSFHLRNIYDKLHVHSKTEAVAKALSQRLIK